MIEKEIIVRETIGVSRTDEYVRVGMPFARGELNDVGGLNAVSPEQAAQPVQATVLGRWSDGSVKWALVEFAASVPAGERATYRLVRQREMPGGTVGGIRVTSGAGAWRVDTGTTVFFIEGGEFRPFSGVLSESGRILSDGSRCTFFTGEGERLTPRADSVIVETAGPLRAVLRLQGHVPGMHAGELRFTSRLHFFAGSSRVMLEFTIHNPQPAQHPGGLWDLGGAGSVLFRELALEVSLPRGTVREVCCWPEPGEAPVRYADPPETLSVYQESSGGENWRSPAHRNREGEVPFLLRGYEIRNGESVVARGTRATPVVWCGCGETGLSAVLPSFWQEFPKALEAGPGGLKIALFPGRFPDLHELQGGERKTHRLHLDFAAPAGELQWARSPLVASASPEAVRRSKAVSDLPGETGEAAKIHDLVDRFCGPAAFIQKRESLDEYGWRNFGELYADHEAVYHRGDEPFVSHYNNQYDPCAGMYRKFLASGDPLWGELAADLARHVLDIDIYHTDGDREEYNRGLFWHTDHYIPAGLATHRSFSRENLRVRDPRFYGGGPGAEHCYTTGLMLHYFLTGDPSFREAVISLAEWCYRSLAGSQTVLAAVNRAARYLSMVRHAMGRGKAFPRYPLSRGTGNTISACCDAWEVSRNRKYLKRAEMLIRGVIHPGDDIVARHLENVEGAWSYTVLLVAVAKFLNKLEELEEYGDAFAYARASLVAYADWMCLHEYPYLDKPGILEYPNETWPAQDLRKSVVFYHAARHAEGDRREAFLSRGRFFYDAAREQLVRHETSGFTRPVALMLQNGWVGSRLHDAMPHRPVSPIQPSTFGSPTPTLSPQAVMKRIGSELVTAVRETSLQRESEWISARLQMRRSANQGASRSGSER